MRNITSVGHRTIQKNVNQSERKHEVQFAILAPLGVETDGITLFDMAFA